MPSASQTSGSHRKPPVWLRVIGSGAILTLMVLARSDKVEAQYSGLDCPGTWIPYGGGSACQCPDGSLADYVGSRVVCRGAPQNIDCGGYYCKPGQKCSRGGGCVPEASRDCGKGRYCPSTSVCSVRTDKCLTPAEADAELRAIQSARNRGITVTVLTDPLVRNTDNCVKFLRDDRGIKLPPTDLTYWNAKQALINVYGSPRPGDVAIIEVREGRFAENGHMALVKAITPTSIAIEETNFGGVRITQRLSVGATLQEAQNALSIVGFYRP